MVFTAVKTVLLLMVKRIVEQLFSYSEWQWILMGVGQKFHISCKGKPLVEVMLSLSINKLWQSQPKLNKPCPFEYTSRFVASEK